MWLFALEQGVQIPEPGPEHVAVGAKVLPMGFSWAVFLAHSTLADIFNEAELSSAAPIEYRATTPSFRDHALLFFLYIDDFAGFTLVEPQVEDDDEPDIGADREAVRAAFAKRGVPLHKEESNYGMKKGLGLTITTFPHRTVLHEKKLRDLVLATEAAA